MTERDIQYLEIRTAESADYEQIGQLLRQLNPCDPVAAEGERKAFDEIIDSSNLFLIVAEIRAAVVSSCYLNLIPNMTRGGKPYAVIENVITDSAYRNQGIGSRVIHRAVEMAWQNNCYKIMLMSGRADAAVHDFYRKCGFNPDQKQAYIQRAR